MAEFTPLNGATESTLTATVKSASVSTGAASHIRFRTYGGERVWIKFTDFSEHLAIPVESIPLNLSGETIIPVSDGFSYFAYATEGGAARVDYTLGTAKGDCFSYPVTPIKSNRVVALGSSITFQNSSKVDSTTESKTLARGWLTWAQVLADPNTIRFDFINSGVGGNTVKMMMNRFEADVVAYRPAVIILESGTNDIASYDEGAIKDDLFKLYQMAERVGVPVVVCSIPKRASTAWTADQKEKVDQINAWIRRKVPEFKNFRFFDWNAAWVDVDATTGDPISGCVRSDNTHLTPKGAFLIGKNLGPNYLKDLFPAASPIVRSPLVTDGTDYVMGNLFPNPLFQGTGGTVSSPCTGTVPTSTRILRSSGSGGCAASINSSTLPDNYNEVQLDFTPAGSAGNSVFNFQHSATNLTTVQDGLYEALIWLDVSAWAGWRIVSLDVYDTEGATGHNYGLWNDLTSESVYMPPYAWQGWVRAQPRRMLGTTARVRLYVDIDDNVAGTGTIKVRDLILRRVG